MGASKETKRIIKELEYKERMRREYLARVQVIS